MTAAAAPAILDRFAAERKTSPAILERRLRGQEPLEEDDPDGPTCGCCGRPVAVTRFGAVFPCRCQEYEHRCPACGRCPEDCCRRKKQEEHHG